MSVSRYEKKNWNWDTNEKEEKEEEDYEFVREWKVTREVFQKFEIIERKYRWRNYEIGGP